MCSLIVVQVFIMYILFFDLFIIIAILFTILFTVEMVRLSLNAFEVKFSFAELLAIKSNSTICLFNLQSYKLSY